MNSGCLRASVQNALSTPNTTTLFALLSPDGRFAIPGNCSIAVVLASISVWISSASFARNNRSFDESVSSILPNRASAIFRKLPLTDSPTNNAPTKTMVPTATPIIVPIWLFA